MTKFLTYYFSIVLLYIGCKGNNTATEKTNTSLPNKKIIIQGKKLLGETKTNPKSSSLIAAIDDLLQSTKYKKYLNNGGSYIIDTETCDSLLINLMENTGQGYSATTGWLKIDLISKSVTDITVDPEKPVIIKVDGSKVKIIAEIIQKKQSCL